MNILSTLKKNPSKADYKRIVAFIACDRKHLGSLITIFLNGPYRITQRASHPMNTIAKTQPHLFHPHLLLLVKKAVSPGTDNAVKRNTMRLLQFIEIPTSLHGRVIDACFKLLKNKTEPIAVKVFSMSVLANLSKTYPGPGQELKIIIEDLLPYASAGIASRGRKILMMLNRQQSVLQ